MGKHSRERMTGMSEDKRAADSGHGVRSYVYPPKMKKPKRGAKPDMMFPGLLNDILLNDINSASPSRWKPAPESAADA